jgi:hypothetical protein
LLRGNGRDEAFALAAVDQAFEFGQLGFQTLIFRLQFHIFPDQCF